MSVVSIASYPVLLISIELNAIFDIFLNFLLSLRISLAFIFNLRDLF